jgi:hypothetical protein
MELENEQKCLDAKIEEITETRRKLLTKRNMFSLINAKLLPELLVRIFYHAITLTWEGRYKDLGRSLFKNLGLSHLNSLVWLSPISHICSYWRSISLSAPILWTRKFPNHPEGMKTFLERSGNAPISIDLLFHTRRDKTPARWDMLRPHISRARKIELSTAPWRDTPILIHEIMIIADVLNHIPQCIEAIDTIAPKMINKFPFEYFQVPADASFPHLRHVSMCYFPFPQYYKIFTGLHTLILRDEAASPSQLDLNHLFDAIEACPELRLLNLGLHMREITLLNKPRPPIMMSSLRTVWLGSSFTPISGAFLSRFALPVATRVVIDEIPRSLREVREISDTLPGLFARSQIPIVRLYVVLHQPDDEDEVKRIMISGYSTASEGIDPEVLGTEMDPETIQINLDDYTVFSSPTYTVLQEILRQGLPYLTKFDCVPQTGLDAQWWTEIFENMPNLRSLTIRGSNIFKDVIVALSSSRDAFPSEDQPTLGISANSNRQPLLPALKILSLMRVVSDESDITRQMVLEEKTPNFDIYGGIFPFLTLVEYLQRRHDCGIGLETLVLPSLKFPPLDPVTSQVAILKGILDLRDNFDLDRCKFLPDWYSIVGSDETGSWEPESLAYSDDEPSNNDFEPQDPQNFEDFVYEDFMNSASFMEVDPPEGPWP